MSRRYVSLLLITALILMSTLSGCTMQKDKTISNPQNSNTNIENEYNESLCKKSEKILFSFKTKKSSKILSICVSEEQPNYIIYRFGTKEKIELEFPDNKIDSWSKFTYSYYLRGGEKENAGLDLNYLSFSRNGFEYQVYQEYSAEDDATNVGIRVKEKATNKETDIIGLSNTVVGSLTNLRENGKIKVEVLPEP